MGLFGKKKEKKIEDSKNLKPVNIGMRHIDDLSSGNEKKQPIPSWESPKENMSHKEKKLQELMKKREELVHKLEDKEHKKINISPPIQMPEKKSQETQIGQTNQIGQSIQPEQSTQSFKPLPQIEKSIEKPKEISGEIIDDKKSNSLPLEIPPLDESFTDDLYDLGDIGIEDIEQITKEAKIGMEEKGDQFVDINSYKEIILGIREIKNDADDSKDFLQRMEKIKDVTDSAIITLTNYVEDIERKLLYIDKEIFEE